MPARRATTNGGAVRILSPRQQEVLALIARGLSTDDIARVLFLSPATVRAHVRNILDVLGASNRAHAVAIACATGLLWLDAESACRHLPHAPAVALERTGPDAAP